ncbi:unnamed protein product [Peniophora sp. CBMAI 1063]|nr:unnamed protein product [Peniophora sp. CBMAI 1063]
MGAADPTFPLYPIACIIASMLLLTVLFSSFVRQSWNLGVAFLCFWLFFENLTFAINAIIWSDNADIKLYVYCDIVSHMQMLTSVVKPMSSLLIMRRLYLISSLQSVYLPDRSTKRKDILIEWTLGFIVPVLYAGPVYYVVQVFRFQVEEGVGCESVVGGGPALLLIDSVLLIPPLLSAILYYPRIIRILYRRHTELNQFLHSNSSISRSCYFRILALASADILFTLSINIVKFALNVVLVTGSHEPHPFYPGWDNIHSDWAPEGIAWGGQGKERGGILIYNQWTAPLFAFVIFSLFGFTEGARASYRNASSTVKGCFMLVLPCARGGRKSTRSTSTLRLNFAQRDHDDRMQNMSSVATECGSSVVDVAPPPPDLHIEAKRASHDDSANTDDESHPGEAEKSKQEQVDMKTADMTSATHSISSLA